MIIDRVNPINKGVLEYLTGGEKTETAVIAAPDSVADPYTLQGSHPDIVHHVWGELSAALPEACRCLLYGTPAIVHDLSGVVIAIANGTQYNLRLTADDFQSAIAKGACTQNRWSNGKTMDSLTELGPNWIFGGWFKEEAEWARNTYEEWRQC